MKTLRKKPLQIYIDPEQDAKLEGLCRKQGVSKAAIIRESLDRYLRNLPIEEDPALAIVGLGSSGTNDRAEKHDDYLIRHTTPKEG